MLLQCVGQRAFSKTSLDAARLVFAFLLTSFVLGQSSPPVSQVPQDLHAQEDDIREAIFRYRIGTNKSESSIFLKINGKDPSNEFMVRFANSKLSIHKASGSYFKKDPFPGYLRDRKNDKEAIEFSVGPIRWITATRVEVRGGMFCGGLCADAGTYQVTKTNDHWTVEKYNVKLIS